MGNWLLRDVHGMKPVNVGIVIVIALFMGVAFVVYQLGVERFVTAPTLEEFLAISAVGLVALIAMWFLHYANMHARHYSLKDRDREIQENDFAESKRMFRRSLIWLILIWAVLTVMYMMLLLRGQ